MNSDILNEYYETIVKRWFAKQLEETKNSKPKEPPKVKVFTRPDLDVFVSNILSQERDVVALKSGVRLSKDFLEDIIYVHNEWSGTSG